ncbi:cell wall integrity and stress response component 4-like isoform X2 [Bradysia coprophila]|uniref:cell wall integrity and stress response component 4-like isoform X2 n=1 Tax=Bradysia coprophila TaxID=38358 RepID=UPI00187D929A|nr:cell wall integrity and stress response component 4-like isoform X2 [Bradysia coprophila]
MFQLHEKIMKSLIFVLSTILTLCQSSTVQNDTVVASSTKNYNLAPLYLLLPNFITTSITDITNYLRKNGFQQKNLLGFAATNSYDCNGNASLIPVYRFHNNITMQYILSTNPTPPNDTTLPYTPDGIAFYAADTFNTNCGGPTAPLHSYWVHNTHFVYTTDKASADTVLVEMEGGTYKGTVCHFWLTDKPPMILPTTTIPTTTVPTTTVPTTTAPTTTVPTTTAPTTTAPTTTVPTTIASTTTIPSHCPVKTVPLWRLYRPLSNNHFYTTSESEAHNAVLSYSYLREGSPGTVAESASDCTCEKNFVPVYRLYRPGILDDHFYTASEDEAIKAQSTYGYIREGIEYYCSLNGDVCGATRPLYRYWRGTDHFYTSNIDEGNRNVIPFGGTYEGIICYIWP